MAQITFEHLAASPVLRRFYSLVWRLFSVNIALISADGRKSAKLEEAPNARPFCLAIHRQHHGHNVCAQCDHCHLQLAMRQRTPLRYTCHAGLREFIIPISLDGEPIAYLQCGQILDHKPTARDWHAASRLLQDQGFDPGPLRKPFFALPSLDPELQKDLVTQLELIGNYIAHTGDALLLQRQTPRQQMVDRAKAFIRAHLAEPIALADVAHAAGTSARSLCRAFRQEAGGTVVDCISQTRIAAACAKLRRGNPRCIDVAFDTGFGSVQQFNRVFKQIVGCTPLAWRQSAQLESLETSCATQP